MIKEFEISHSIIPTSFFDDLENQVLSPLSCLREFSSYWSLEFDLPLVHKKDIKITLDGNMLTTEAKLKETYYEEKFGKKTEFQYFKRSISLPTNINNKKISAKFENGRLTIKIPKSRAGKKITIE